MPGSSVEIFQEITLAGRPGESIKRKTWQRVTHCSCALLPGSFDQALTVICIVTQFARESFGICGFRGSCMREYDLSNQTKRLKNRTWFACEDVGLCPFCGSTVKECNLFTRSFCSIGFLRNHLLSENMQWNYAPFNVTHNHLMHKTMEFCVTSSLALDNWEQKYCQTLGSKPNDSHRVLRRRLFSKGKNLNYAIVCFTQCTLLFQKVCFLLQICLPSVIYGTYVTKINAVLWHSARLTFASLGLFTFARIACLLQLWMKRSDLGNAQIISEKLTVV